MKIKDVIFSEGKTGFFFDDQKAIKKGASQDGFIYIGKPEIQGFEAIRQAGESISVIILLEDGQIAVGDCAAVQYSGAGGRDPLFLANKYIPFLEKNIKPLLIGENLKSFKDLSRKIDNLIIDGNKIHTALRYGLSQAILDAISKAYHETIVETIWREYNLPKIIKKVPIFGQSGDERYTNVDKMILKEADVLPHGLINNVETKLGKNGELLKEYISWIVNRIKKIRIHSNYNPTIHIDVYGTIGIIFDNNIEKIADYLASLEKYSESFQLYIEGPVDLGEKNRQIEYLSKIKERLENNGSKVKIVADEWCNTFEDIIEFTDAKACHMVQIKTPDLGSVHNIIESVIYCKNNGMEAYQGGTCNETDVSARICTNIGVAVQSDRLLAKPGMGFDEGFAIVKNEMERILNILKYKDINR
ncbi:MAG: methylaspartate ammonia-lyase [Exilispira sp.]|jgi:methylaspartate ammonia-lyase|nr:methylaspartate ammonia-lyase [Exilispira sp.]